MVRVRPLGRREGRSAGWPGLVEAHTGYSGDFGVQLWRGSLHRLDAVFQSFQLPDPVVPANIRPACGRLWWWGSAGAEVVAPGAAARAVPARGTGGAVSVR